MHPATTFENALSIVIIAFAVLIVAVIVYAIAGVCRLIVRVFRGELDTAGKQRPKTIMNTRKDQS